MYTVQCTVYNVQRTIAKKKLTQSDIFIRDGTEGAPPNEDIAAFAGRNNVLRN